MRKIGDNTNPMVKIQYKILLPILICLGCSSNEKFKKKEAAQVEANYVMENLNKEEVKSHFPPSKFPSEQTNLLLGQLSNYCDWATRQGKYVDQASIKSNGRDYAAFIYEYILKCDSMRFILIYDLEQEKPELSDFKVEKLSKDNPLIIHKENQLLKSK